MSRDPSSASAASSGHAPVEPTLVLQAADGSTREFPVTSDEPVTLGRDPSNTIVLDSTFVSKRHAMVAIEGGQCVVRDLKSSNGIRVNGSAVALAPLKSGDILEVGDQTLTFVDRGAGRGKSAAPRVPDRRAATGAAAAAAPSGPAPPSPMTKLLRLGGVALVVGVGLFLGLRYIFIKDDPAAALLEGPPVQTSAAAWLPEGMSPAPPAKDSPLVRQVLAQSKTAGVNPADALYDEAVTQYESGRLMDAARLFSATLERDPARTSAKARLGEVREELELAIARHRAEAERLLSQLRYADAVSEWDRVLSLLEPEDPRVPAAKAGLEAARRLVTR
jgi:pSer/pThr/pTyr-binding forkhead associated (FHA) protein